MTHVIARRLAGELCPCSGIGCVDIIHRYEGYPGPQNEEVDRGDPARECSATLICRESSRVRCGHRRWDTQYPENSRRRGY